MKKYSLPQKIEIANRQWIDKAIEHSPRWCAVDLRDGNQALPNPLTVEQKIKYFGLLLSIGFKEIEIGFPSASQEEFKFCRYLIEENKVPEDVIISALSPCRTSLIARTLEAIEGVNNPCIHIYIATSDLHHKFILKKSKQELIEIALQSVQFIIDNKASPISLEFSCEEFTDTDLDFSIEICQAVTDLWQEHCDEEIILNLPATVERRGPTDYADMIELFQRGLKIKEDNVSISLHAHNDMGCGVAATQLAIQAGANRVEGTLFGHGERSGNIDLVTLAINLEYLGVNHRLDFSNLMDISNSVEEITGIKQHCRHPYVGALVFSAFSGSHQDAIHKSMRNKNELTEYFGGWKIPYLHVDPSTLGRKFEKLVRINSQSGRGGLKHVLKLEKGVELPTEFINILIKNIQSFSEKVSREITSEEIWGIFDTTFKPEKELLKLVKYLPYPYEKDDQQVIGKATLVYKNETIDLEAIGNGPIAAFKNILSQLTDIPEFLINLYKESSLGDTANAEALCCISLENIRTQKIYHSLAVHCNSTYAACLAITNAMNKLLVG